METGDRSPETGGSCFFQSPVSSLQSPVSGFRYINAMEKSGMIVLKTEAEIMRL